MLPDFASCDDQTVERHLPSLDGRWSQQTKDLLKALGSSRLELNASWAWTPVDWCCPVCRRSKPQIARLTPAGVVLCQLDRHHDHLGDEGRRILWRRQAKPSGRAGRDALWSAIGVCAELSERFHETLVCNDCNAADGAAKAALSDVALPSFSFAPSEIARFIRVTPNRAHDIDRAMARAIWDEVAVDVAERLAFMHVMADRIAAGHHVREGTSYKPHRQTILLTDIVASLGSRRSDVEWLGGAVEARSIQRDGFGSSVTKAVRKSVAVPTPKDLAEFTANLRPGDFWHCPPEDWRCATCERTRFEMLRKSPKSGRWTAAAHRRRVFTIETRRDALWRREGWYGGGLVYGGHQWEWICKDCRQIITDTKQTGQNLTDDCLSIQDVRSLLITIRPHDRPDFDRDMAACQALQNHEMMAAIEDYDQHRKRCLNLFYDRRQRSRFQSDSDIDQIQLVEIWEGHIEDEQRPGQLAWLLEEGRLYAEANARDWSPERAVHGS